jgi:hypothetical protein
MARGAAALSTIRVFRQKASPRYMEKGTVFDEGDTSRVMEYSF